MAGKSGAAFLTSIADWFVSTGLDKLCFTFVNSDEGWEEHDRDNVTHELVPNPAEYPMGIPALVATLAAKGVGIKLGLYGAASGVTCGGVSGQLGYERLDAETLARWGVGYWKSDNCASYAMDSSVRFAATRDALLRTKAPIVYSIEPFSIAPDTRQSTKLANLWRVAQDICRTYECTLNRASVSDKWAPLAGPGGWNVGFVEAQPCSSAAPLPLTLAPPRAAQDPDMMNMGPHMTPGENRVLFGLWALSKAPLLLSADLPQLPQNLKQIILSPEVIALNQDPAGVQGRKLLLDGEVMPWLVGLESCAGGPGGGPTGMRNRGWDNSGSPPLDTRVWSAAAHASVAGAVTLANAATGRCLAPGTAQGLATVVLLPCNSSDAAQAWAYGEGGAQTVTALVHAVSGLALVVGNSTLFSAQHGKDPAPLPDAAYGAVALGLGPYTPTQPCTARNCSGYDPSQLWYGPDDADGFIAQATFVASINHCDDGACYSLTARAPTYQHHCLAHVLSVRNAPSDSGALEVWGGPLAGGAFALGLLNAGGADGARVAAPFSALGAPGVGPNSTFCVRSLWSPAADVGTFTGAFEAAVPAHDLALFRLTPGAC